MGSVLGKILSVAIAPISLINKRAGEIISGITLTAIGAASGNPGLVAIGIGEFAKGIAPKPPGPHGEDTSQKTGIPDRVGAYGMSGIIGKYTFYQTDPNSGVAGDMYAFVDCWWAPIDGCAGLFLGDDRVAAGPGVVQGLKDGTYTDGKVEIDVRLGARVNTAYSQIVALFPSVTAQSRGDGVATGMVTWQPVKSKNYTKYYPKGQPPLRMVARWSKVYDWRDETQSLTDPLTWKWSDNPVLQFTHYELIRDGAQTTQQMVIAGAVNSAWVAELAGILRTKWNKLFAPTINMWTSAANDCDTQSAIPIFRSLVSADDSPDGDHTILIADATGLTVGATITISALDDINHTETRNVTSISGSASTGYTIGLDSEVAYFHGQGSTVTWDSTDANPLFEKRYRSCVSHSLTDAHKDTKTAILSTFDGWVSPRDDGALVIYSGRFVEPTVSIGPDQIVSFSLDDGIEDENAVNELTLTYTEAALDYKVVDCTSWRDDDDIASRGRIATQPLQNQVPSYTQARRLAKRQLARIMAQKRGTTTTNADGRSVIGQRYISQNLTEGGVTWLNATVEINDLTNNLETGGVTYSWTLADPNIDSWDPATEAGDPAPVGNVVSAAALDAPTITTAAVEYGAQSGDDTTGTYIQLTVANPMGTRDDIQWHARTRIQGAAIWGTRDYDDITPGATVTINTEFVPANAMVEVEVAYTTGDGRQSDWSVSEVVNTATDQTPPDAATIPVLASWADSLNLTTSLIARARTYRWRFYDTAATPNMIASIDTTSNAISYSAAQAALDGVKRAYNVKVSGVNSAGEGTAAITTTAFTKPAPAAVTTPAIAGGATTAVGTCDAATGATGYAVFYYSTSGFDPVTTGGVATSGVPNVQIFGLSAATYYGHIAAFDEWSSNPALLNLSSEISFAITTGGGSTPSGGGISGGGYNGGKGQNSSV